MLAVDFVFEDVVELKKRSIKHFVCLSLFSLCLTVILVSSWALIFINQLRFPRSRHLAYLLEKRS